MLAIVLASVSTSSRSVGRRHDAIDQSEPQSLGGADLLAGQHQLERGPGANETRQALCAAVPGNQAEIDLRLTELRRVRRDTKRARHRELTAAAERETIDGGDCRFAEVLEEIEDALATKGLFACSRGRLLRQLVDVGASNERLVASSGNHDDADSLVAPEIDQRRLEFVQRPGAESVHDRADG